MDAPPPAARVPSQVEGTMHNGGVSPLDCQKLCVRPNVCLCGVLCRGSCVWCDSNSASSSHTHVALARPRAHPSPHDARATFCVPDTNVDLWCGHLVPSPLCLCARLWLAATAPDARVSELCDVYPLARAVLRVSRVRSNDISPWVTLCTIGRSRAPTVVPAPGFKIFSEPTSHVP